MKRVISLLAGDPQADKVVPPSGFTARLTTFTAGAMAFLAVFALALSLATNRLASRWSAELARTSTLRISAPEDQVNAQVQAAMTVLLTTPGIENARPLEDEEQRALLEPWFGPDLPIETLPIPQLIEIVEDRNGYDATGLRARLQAEAPGAILDDHTRWREPLVSAANRIRTLGLLALGLIGLATAAMISLAAQSALSANGQVVRVLRLVGARDTYIARAFVRRFTIRSAIGAMVGTVLGMIAIALLPSADEAGGFLTGLGFTGFSWMWPLFIPIFAALVGFFATRAAAFRNLGDLS